MNSALLREAGETTNLLFVGQIQSDANKIDKLKLELPILWKAKQIAADKIVMKALG